MSSHVLRFNFELPTGQTQILAVAISFFLLPPPPASAGTVLLFNNAPAIEGKLTLTATGIHVDGSVISDLNFSDILEADFSDDPLHIPYFNSASDDSMGLPPGWTAKAIGGGAGSATYSKGTLTLTGDGSGYQDKQPDHYYFAGQPWSGDGQWTAYLAATTGELGFMLRKGLNQGDGIIAAGGGDDGGGTMTYLRLTRIGSCLDTTDSQDGKSWQVISQDVEGDDATKYWVGFMINSRQAKEATGIINQVLFTPAPPQPETMPIGVLLTSGTFIAGIDGFYLSETNGGVSHANHSVAFKTSEVSAVMYHPTTLSEIKAQPSRGLILRNGDFLVSDIKLLNGMVQMASIALGAVNLYSDKVRAVVVNPIAPIPSDYEIRLKDESIIRAKSFEMTNGQLEIQEVGGVTIFADPAEVVAFRAGTARVQPLINLPWKDMRSPSVEAKTAAGVPLVDVPVPTNIDTSPAAPADGIAIGVAFPVMSWEGPNHEQIIALAANSPVEFPLKGNFETLVTGVAMAPGTPANTEATLHVLSDGKEIASTPAIRVGDNPRSVGLKLGTLNGLTLKVQSVQPGARLMLIDPVAVRGQ